jgi:hypothetical protein
LQFVEAHRQSGTIDQLKSSPARTGEHCTRIIPPGAPEQYEGLRS